MAEKYCVHISLTERCSHRCVHCSGLGNGKGKSADFAKLKKALAEIAIYAKVLYISCEGDPFDYKSGSKGVIDAMRLVFDSGVKSVSFQSAVPSENQLPLLSGIVKLLKDRPDIRFFPQLSFNLYYPEVFCRGGLDEYIRNFKKAVSEYSSLRCPIHFEVRYDRAYTGTSRESTMTALKMALKNLPESRYTIKESHIVPLGRAKKLLRFRGQYEHHVYAQEGLCPNWKEKMIIVDTKGFPLLCYSNLSTTPELKNSKGPNLYRDGFAKVLKFYEKFWEQRELSRKDTHCPMPLFKRIKV